MTNFLQEHKEAIRRSLEQEAEMDRQIEELRAEVAETRRLLQATKRQAKQAGSK